MFIKCSNACFLILVMYKKPGDVGMVTISSINREIEAMGGGWVEAGKGGGET